MNPQVSSHVGSVGASMARGHIGPGHLSVMLPGWPPAVKVARDLLARALGPAATDDLLLCAAEAVTNAIEHSRSGVPGGQVVLTARAEPGSVLVTVMDGGPLRPADPPAAESPAGEHGRGLMIINALSAEWGWGDAFAGRTCWFRILLPDAVAGTVTRDAPRDAPRDAGVTPDRDGPRDTSDRDALADLALAGSRS